MPDISRTFARLSGGGETASNGNRREAGETAGLRSRRAPPVTIPAPTPLAPKPVVPAVAKAPAAVAKPVPTPIGKSLLGAILGAVNQSPGNTGSSRLSRAAVRRAQLIGVQEKDIVTNVDESGL